MRLRIVALLFVALTMTTRTSSAGSFHKSLPPEGEILFYHHQVCDTATDDCNAMRTRLRLTWTPEVGWGGQVFLDGRNLVGDQLNPNWLQDAYVSYASTPATRVRAGRLFLAAMFQTPPSHLLRTVRYLGNDPYGVYAYGVQVEHRFGTGQSWQLIADVAGNSNRNFDDPGQFERGELSLFLERKTKVTWNIGAQLSPDFTRFGVGTQYRFGERVNLSGSIYYDSARIEHVTGFTTLEVQATSWLSSRAVVEHDVNGDITLMPGVLVRPCKYFWLTAERRRDAYAMRIQIRL